MSCQVNADTAIGTFCSVSLRRFAVTTMVPSVVTVPEFSVDFVVFWSGGAFCACASGAPSSAAVIAAERSENPLRLVFMDHPPEALATNRCRTDCYANHITMSMLFEYQIAYAAARPPARGLPSLAMRALACCTRPLFIRHGVQRDADDLQGSDGGPVGLRRRGVGEAAAHCATTHDGCDGPANPADDAPARLGGTGVLRLGDQESSEAGGLQRHGHDR